ncbi:flagellar assembly protein FliW [Brevibacillus sp. 7WMA2]|uniref:Flagellar assembly factor FliW n=1 Tax=Brevibacillus laterosporus LMG 15441 TaxID=1042163 RepID=A0A075R9S6_BRELA|nr:MULTISPECIES: flagellar assembly protein FliW [Brevibacillus]AIG28639.1 flagellar assembly factor FliW [Brevibacillus laterosporus LMG 15441]AUM66973.1 flagellar assembly protein FliW [Brevibacillus laterosporus]AYK05832.1 flagellar assembly protein FliW [Brevibacillus laterosporus]ERM17110.1 flagellar assembly protein FliW [Brevibacillus laterosporus PE36]MCR8963025.1 flagellar assembly protein FliW [Brevibacillus laterosporus]
MMYQQEKMGKLYIVEGMIGFSNLHEYQLVQENPEMPFLSLQSLEEQGISFWVVDPFLFFKDYEFDLPRSVREALEITEESQVVILSVMTIRGKDQITVNLKSPLVINVENRKATQFILQGDHYNLRQPLLLQKEKPVTK